MSKPLVSVLITSYNRSAFIAEAIESVLNQTFTNFELIIVDDASTDITYDIAASYAANDKRIRLYRNEINLGQFLNRNKAASLAQGIYIKFVDSDDIIYSFCLHQMILGMEQFQEAGFGVCSNLTNDVKPYPYLVEKSEAYKQYFTQGSDILGMGPLGVIFRTNLFHSIGGFNDCSILGDTSILFEAIQRSPVVKIGASQFWWRIHENQVFTDPLLVVEHIIQRHRIHITYLNEKYTNYIGLPIGRFRLLQYRIYFLHFFSFLLRCDIRSAARLWKYRNPMCK